MSMHALDDADRLRLSFGRELMGLARAERRAELAVGGGFLAAAVALIVLSPAGQSFSPPVAAIYVLALGVATRVRFDVGAGFTVPTQIVFVPMLFAGPAQY